LIVNVRIKGKGNLPLIFGEKKNFAQKRKERRRWGTQRKRLFFKNSVQPLIRI